MSSGRRTRLQSSSPYGTALKTRTAERRARQTTFSLPPALGATQTTLPPSSLPSTAPSSPQSSPGPSTTPPAPLSSTAKLILSTLDRLSSGGTPVTDAKKIPLSTPNRAEKRKLLETELNCSLSSPSRRRARLGGGGLALALSGPPLRKNYSPSMAGTKRIQASPRTPAEPPIAPPPQPSGPSSVSSTVTAPANISEQVKPVTNNLSKAKSSFKVKTKVTESVREKVDTISNEPPPSPLSVLSDMPQLKVDTMPVLNFSSTPAPTKLPSTTSNGLSATPSRAPETIERNNNRSPIEKSDSPKKIKSGANGELSNAVVTSNHDSSTCSNGSKTNEKVVPEVKVRVTQPRSTNPPAKYIFSAPKSVIGKTENLEKSGKIFSFCSPVFVKKSKKMLVMNGPLVGDATASTNVRLNSGMGNSPIGLVNSTTPSLNTNFMFNKINSMPDVTNNLVKKSPLKEKLKGSSSGLPDITASTGFGGFVPAKELKTGSVMDILGKKAWSPSPTLSKEQ